MIKFVLLPTKLTAGQRPERRYNCALDNGFELVQEIVRGIAKEYGWVDYRFALPE